MNQSFSCPSCFKDLADATPIKGELYCSCGWSTANKVIPFVCNPERFARHTLA